MSAGVETRARAADLVHRVLDAGAYSNVVVRTETQDLSTRDAAFVQRLLYTVLRLLPRLDHTIAAYASRPLARIDTHPRNSLRVGTAELLFLESSPHAAVDAAVEAVRRRGGERAVGFVNAVLRRVADGGEAPLPPGDDGVALEFGVAPWLLARLVASWGKMEATSFLAASNEPARIGLRMRTDSVDPPGEPVPGIPDARWCHEPGAAAAAVERAEAAVADPASVAVGCAVAAEPGMRVGDLAAAPGGKTLHLDDQMHGVGLLVAADRHARRVQTARRRLARLGAGAIWVHADARQPPFAPHSLDRVLLDAPCSGLGTLRRRPEVKHRITPQAATLAGQRQRAMLETALNLVIPDGLLVYSVCTVLPEETIEVVTGLGGRAPSKLPGRRWGDGLLMAPHITGTDGMFIAVFDR